MKIKKEPGIMNKTMFQTTIHIFQVAETEFDYQLGIQFEDARQLEL